ncbi:MAG: decaprenyl-phosphate phosphoribosyltransferase [Pyrinomonadaceae bacterium]
MSDSQFTPNINSAHDASLEISRVKTTLRGVILSLRPHQWVKNLLVFGGLIFSHSLLQASAVWLSVTAFIMFCMVSSAIYILNDMRDTEADRMHPLKRLRPLAAGTISRGVAGVLMCVLLTIAGLGSLTLRPSFSLVICIYVATSIAYSFGLKRMVIVDVMIIAFGFVLRAIGGALVLDVTPSAWLMICTLLLALLIGFGKRRHELTLLQNMATQHRQSLGGYTVALLDSMMTIAGGAAVVSFALYTVADETVARFGSRNLIITLPFVIYGVFRYLYLVHKNEAHNCEDPSQLLVTDAPTIINIIFWACTVCAIIYTRGAWKIW